MIDREQGWLHYQRLIGLTGFSDKFDYWTREVCKDDLYFSIVFTDKPEFKLELIAETSEERHKLHKFWLDHFRNLHDQEKYPVDTFGWQWSEADQIKTAYRVQSFEVLIKDLENRLLSSANKQSLLERELTLITTAIDKVGRTVNKVRSTLAFEIQELRDSYVLNRPYDLAFTGDISPRDKAEPLQKIARLSLVWDIIKYEANLKVRVAKLKDKTSDKLKSITNDELNLSNREKALIICYEGEHVIKKGEPNYNDYITFSTIRKRLAYPNDSISKAKPLIKSIKKILPYLSEAARKQAVSEIEIIEAKLETG